MIDQIEEVSDVMVHIDPEDDETATLTGALPLRHAVEQRLGRYFREIEAARHIEKVSLHYVDGRIKLELLLPLDVLSDIRSAEDLRRRFGVEELPEISHTHEMVHMRESGGISGPDRSSKGMFFFAFLLLLIGGGALAYYAYTQGMLDQWLPGQ